MQDKMKVTLSASRIGAYYGKLCKRNLVYDAVNNKKDLIMLGWEKPERTDSSDALAGDKWEAEVFQRIQNDPDSKVMFCDADDRKKYSFEQTLDVLKQLDKTQNITYIYQACVRVTRSFQKEYLPGCHEYGFQLEFSDMYPDFIRAEYINVEDKFRLTIIDVKNADHVKVNAQIQISLYAMMLKSILKDYHIDHCYVNEEEGIVWNKERITKNLLEHSFELKDAKKEIRTFFTDILPGVCTIIEKSENGRELLDMLPFRISMQCEYCGNFENCHKEAVEARSARLLPYMSEEAQNRLTELVELEELSDDSVDSVRTYLMGPDSQKMTDGCLFWKNVKNDMEAYETAMKSYFAGEKVRISKKGSSVSFPQFQHFALMLTAQRDVDSGRIYAYAWYLEPAREIDIFEIGKNEFGYADIQTKEGQEKGEGSYYGTIIAENNTEEEFRRIDREFVEKIYDILERISEQEENDTLQWYVMDQYERNNIEEALYYMLEELDSEKEQELLEKVMTILFWLQGERMVTESSEMPEEIIENPMVVIVPELSRLYALSMGISYNLTGISEIFSPDYNFSKDSDYYFEKLSDVMDGMPILNIWKCSSSSQKEASDKLKSMRRHLIKRLQVEAAIVSAVQKDCRDGMIRLSTRAASYQMQEKVFEGYPEIARLDFENRYEELLKYHQIRNVRMRGIDNAIDEGNILSLECLDGNRYNVLNWENYSGREWFTAWICEDNSFNREQILLLRDTKYKNSLAGVINRINEDGKEIPVFYTPDFENDYDFRDTGHGVTMRFRARDSRFIPKTGKKYLLFEVYKDFNSPKVRSGLKKLKSRPELLDPNLLAGNTEVSWNKEKEEICRRYWSPDGLEFSSSQKEAFIHLFNRKLNVLIGPPAAGKTDFIARSVITLCRYYKEVENRDFKIMISAMSHSAINNVLIKIAKLLNHDAEELPDIYLYKMERFDEEDSFLEDNVSLVTNSYDLDEILREKEISVIGMTGWSACKQELNMSDAADAFFDMVIIDEASQVRAMDAFLQLECGGENTRYMLVGDDDQLPPIIGGKYRYMEGSKYIHGSIFKLYLTALGQDHEDIVHLNDNYRMNNILCRYSAEKIYGLDYKARIPGIAGQKIRLLTKSGDELLDFMLDPEYPLVFCKLSGLPRDQKNAEVELVTKLIRELWDKILNEDGEIAGRSGNFWHEKTGTSGKAYDGACGIISPHHEHINRLLTAVEHEIGCPRQDIFIGTVDKLQGKERQTVIVSYGVSDRETVVRESEFLFSRNRFNVSLTRGKAKTIVLLSDVIAQSNISTNVLKGKGQELEKGIAFIQGFEDFMEHAAPDEEVMDRKFTFQGGNVTLHIRKKRILNVEKHLKAL